MARNDPLYPAKWMDKGVAPGKLSKEVVDTDRWDREDRARMLKEVEGFSAARARLGKFAATGDPAMLDMFAMLLKAEPEVKDAEKVQPSHLVNRKILEEAASLDVTQRLRRYTVNDDVQSALSCEQIEPDLEVLFDKTAAQRKKAEQFQQMLQDLAAAQQEQVDLDDLFDRWTKDEDVDVCPECQGTGQVPDDSDGEDGEDGEDAQSGQEPGDQPGEGEGEEGDGDGEGQGQGQGTKECPTCNGTGQGQSQGDGEGEGEGEGEGQPGGKGKRPGKGKGKASGNNPGGKGRKPELTDEQRQQLEQFAKQQEEIREKIEAAQAAAQAAGDDFEKDMNAVRASVRGQVNDMLEKAEKAAAEAQETAMTWGLTPGELHRLPAKERMDLAKRLNNERFRRVAKLFGPMKNMMMSEQERKVVHTNEEVFDVTIGADLGRILPQELIGLKQGKAARLDFYRRFTEGKLLQYDLQGKEKLANGAIIFCEDGSGSMSGDREMWAKAVMLCLLHLARQKKRQFHLLHFGGPGQVKHIGFETEADFTLDRVLDAAELFFGGGTDFATPMKRAMDLIDKEQKATGRTKADVVFVTDDECWVTEAFMAEYLAFMEKAQSTTWGISVSGADRREGALDTMTQGKVATIKDFFTGGDIRSIFRGV